MKNKQIAMKAGMSMKRKAVNHAPEVAIEPGSPNPPSRLGVRVKLICAGFAPQGANKSDPAGGDFERATPRPQKTKRLSKPFNFGIGGKGCLCLILAVRVAHFGVEWESPLEVSRDLLAPSMAQRST